MKKSSIKLNILIILAVFAIALGVILMSPLQKINASANTPTPANTFEMTGKASIRLEEDVNGLRFKVKMSSDVKERVDAQNAELGFMVFPLNLLGDVNADYINLLSQKVTQTVNKEKIYQEGDCYYANVVLGDILEENFDKQFTSIAYLKEGESYSYATFDRTFSRSINYIAEQEILLNPAFVAKVQGAYSHIGTTEHPVPINGADDYAVIAQNVAGGATYEGVHFKVMDDFTLQSGYTSIGTGFAGTVDGNNKTVVTYTDGSVAKFAENMENVTNLTFNAYASAVLVVQEGSEARFVNDKGTNGTSTFIASDNAAISGFTGGYTGNAVKVNLSTDVNYPSINLAFSGVAPADKEYVHFWFAVNTNYGLGVTAKELFYSENVERTGGIIVAGSTTSNGLKYTEENQWYEYYLPVEVFNNYMQGIYEAGKNDIPVAKENINMSFHCVQSWASENPAFYFGDITFVDNAFADLEKEDATPFGPAYKKQFRQYSAIEDLKTVEYLPAEDIPSMYTSEQMSQIGFTGATDAYEVPNALYGSYGSVYRDYLLDVSSYSIEQLDALLANPEITHLEISFGLDNYYPGSGDSNRIDNASVNIKVGGTGVTPLLKRADFGWTTNGNPQQIDMQWKTYKILKADFVELAKQSKTAFTGKYVNKVPLFTAIVRSTCDLTVYMGEIKLAFDQTLIPKKDHFANSELASNGFTNDVGYTGDLDRYTLEREVSDGSNMSLAFDVSEFDVSILNDYTEIEIFFAWDVTVATRVIFAEQTYLWNTTNPRYALVKPASRIDQSAVTGKVTDKNKVIQKFTLDIETVKSIFARAKNIDVTWNKNQVRIINFFIGSGNEKIDILLGTITLKNSTTNASLSLLGRSDLPILTKAVNGDLL